MSDFIVEKELFVTREVVSYTGGALVSGKKDLVDEASYQICVNGRGAGEMICSPWGLQEAFLGYLYLKGYISSAGDVRAIDVDGEHRIVNITIREYLTEETGAEDLLMQEETLWSGRTLLLKHVTMCVSPCWMCLRFPGNWRNVPHCFAVPEVCIAQPLSGVDSFCPTRRISVGMWRWIKSWVTACNAKFPCGRESFSVPAEFRWRYCRESAPWAVRF